MADDVKILGMPAESGRWILIIIGTIIELCLGAVYAYSILSVPLKKIFTDPVSAGGFGLTVSAIEMQLPYIVSLAMFALTMPLVGKYIETMGPRKVGMIGGVIVGLGWILASFATSPTTLAVLYGFVAGVGVGSSLRLPDYNFSKMVPGQKRSCSRTYITGIRFLCICHREGSGYS